MKAVLILCVVVAAAMAAPQGQVVDPGFYQAPGGPSNGQVVDPGFYQGPSGGHGGQGGRYVNGVHVVDQASNSGVHVVDNVPNNGVTVVENPDNAVGGVNAAGYPQHLNRPGGNGVGIYPYPLHLYSPPGAGGSNPNVDIGPVYANPPVPGGTWNRPIRPRPGVHPGARDGK